MDVVEGVRGGYGPSCVGKEGFGMRCDEVEGLDCMIV